MMNHRLEVKLVSPNLRPEETILQIHESLQHFLGLSNNVFSHVNDRISQTKQRADRASARAKLVQNCIEEISGSTKAYKVFSSATYPVPENNAFGFPALDVPASPKSAITFPVRNVTYPAVEDKKLQEKRNFYHVGTPEKINGFKLERKPFRKEYTSLSEALFYSADSARSEDDEIVSSTKWKAADEDLTAPLLGEAPPSITRRGQTRHFKVDELHYHPQVPELPEIELPLALPDLPGIAEDFDSEAMAPTFMPVLSLPDLSSLMVVEEKPMERLTATLSVSSLPALELSQPAVPALMGLPPPPPPPPPMLAPPPLVTSSVERPANIEAVLAPPVASGAALDMHGSLMDAIRKAGGTKKLKSVAKDTDKEPSNASPIPTTPSTSKPSGGPGDLMADLMAKLSTRRKGISGSRAQEPPSVPTPSAPGGMLAKVSSLIPPPPTSLHTEEEEVEELWND